MKEKIILPEGSESIEATIARYTAENTVELRILQDTPMQDFSSDGVNVLGWALAKFSLDISFDTILHARKYFEKIGITITNLTKRYE